MYGSPWKNFCVIQEYFILKIKRKGWGGGNKGGEVEVVWWGPRYVCADFVRMQIARSRLGIDEIGGRVTEPQKLEINCRRHTASHYSEATWPFSTPSQSISYYNHANCSQIRDLTYWYYIAARPLGYASLLEASNNMKYTPLLFSVYIHQGKTPPKII